jgi:branched-subunit amino acid transport protein
MEGSVGLRFSISRLMAFILFTAVGLAAAMAGAFTFAVVALSAATLGAVLRHGPSRVFFLGCALFGWAFMLLAFGAGSGVRNSLPTIRPIVRFYEAIHGPGPMWFKTLDEAHRWHNQAVEAANDFITIGHSLIALALALIGGVVTWLERVMNLSPVASVV